MTKLIGAFREFAYATKKCVIYVKFSNTQHVSAFNSPCYRGSKTVYQGPDFVGVIAGKYIWHGTGSITNIHKAISGKRLQM
jgi:hypothetical protein